jgi:ATP-binding cassette, subfamily B, bacterial
VRDAVEAGRLMLGIAWEMNRKLFFGHVLVTVAGVFAPLLLAFGLRPLVNGTYYRQPDLVLLGGALCLVAVLVLVFAPPAERAFATRSIETMIMVLQRRILRLTAGHPRLDEFEDPALWDRLQLLRRSFGDVLMGMFGLFVTPIVVVQLAVTAVAMVRLDARLLVLPLLTVPLAWLHQRAERLEQASEREVSPLRRSITDVFKLATSADSGKEVRVYGLSGELVRRHRSLAGQVTASRELAMVRAVGLRLAGYLLLAAAYTGALYLVVREAVRGGHSPGDVALLLSLAAVLVGAAMVGSRFTSVITRSVTVSRSYRELVDDLARRPAHPAGGNGRRPASPAARGFVLDGVGFRYGASDRFALSDVSATLPAGCVVALVGENGAGKTTLVKLLTRMYEPTAGRILLDGADVAGLVVEGYRRGLSASFQDFVRFQLSARDAVAIGDLDRSRDDEAVRSALERARCEFVYELPRGWDTQLGRDWEGGVDLSGGQWQKLAIARGMMRREARLVVFDEPTASLDPRSEFEIFEQVAAEARSAAGERVTLLISHRFSTVRMADLILVLRDGRLVEQGTHEQLMALDGGLYAELYRLQARAYLAP